MKKFVCAVLAIAMLCGVAAFVGCKKDQAPTSNKGGNSNFSTEVGGAARPEWDL